MLFGFPLDQRQGEIVLGQADAPRIYGRRLRSERTRQIIIEAYLELLRRQPGMPTAAQIAEAAGYSVRSVFERFADLNALTLATADHAIVQAQAEAEARDVSADRATRIRSHVRIRAQSCEKWAPLWRVLVATESQLPDLATRVALTRHGNIARMRLMYAPELGTLTTAEADELLITLAALFSFESWDQMRGVFALSADSAEAAWRHAMDRILPPTPLA